MKILYVVTEDWYFVSHRLELAIAACAAGHEPVVATKAGSSSAKISAAGLRLVPFQLARQGGNPIAEILALIRLYRRERPDIIHHIALKPVVYGSLAVRFVKGPKIVNAVAGLGWLFASTSVKARLLRPVMELALATLLKTARSLTIVQNPDDAAVLSRIGVPRARLRLILGAGVDTDVFSPREEAPGPIRVVLASRMLRDKGVLEFVGAARTLGQRTTSDGRAIEFVLVGPVDAENPASIAEGQLREWEREGAIEWWGPRNDIPDVFQQSHIVCLPSYREGLPKVLIEAAACGRPIVATDVPGCREVVRDGENGFLVPARDAASLADALWTLAEDESLRVRMGSRGRELALSEFSSRRIIAETLAVYQDLNSGI